MQASRKMGFIISPTSDRCSIFALDLRSSQAIRSGVVLERPYHFLILTCSLDGCVLQLFILSNLLTQHKNTRTMLVGALA